MNIKDLLHNGLKVDLVPLSKGTMTLQMSHGNVNERGVKAAVTSFLTNLAVDLTDPNFKETPRRVSKLWFEWVKAKTLEIKVFGSPADTMVTLVKHRTISICPHHLLPFELICDVGYIPMGHMVGLSKLARLADFCSSSFLLQENIAELIAETLASLVLPKGVAVRLLGTHGCMKLRGVRTEGHVVTTALRGVFLTDDKARTEFEQACNTSIPNA